MSLLKANNLVIRFSTSDGHVFAVNNVGFELAAGETLGVVGESGSGKSQLMLSLLGLLADNGEVTGEAVFQGQDLLKLSSRELSQIRGNKIAMIFQDPMTALNPYLRIGKQMTETLMRHKGIDSKAAQQQAEHMLDAVQIPNAKRQLRSYPHELSGGMRQRVMIAMALLCKPDILIADEPTTALDVTVQAQILKLLRELKRDFDTAIILITHDLGVVAGVCDRVMVMYAGQVIEQAPVDELFKHPQHPYTQGLLQSLPRLDSDPDQPLATIAGNPPNLKAQPKTCSFAERCHYRFDRCDQQLPVLQAVNTKHDKACFLDAL